MLCVVPYAGRLRLSTARNQRRWGQTQQRSQTQTALFLQHSINTSTLTPNPIDLPAQDAVFVLTILNGGRAPDVDAVVMEAPPTGCQ